MILVPELSLLIGAVKNGGEGFVDQEAQGGGQQALKQGEGSIEDNQALQQAVDTRANGLIHGDDFIDCHELGVDRVRDVVITGDGEKGHHHRTGQRAEEGAFPGLLIVINHASGEGKSGAQDKIAQFPSVNGGGAFDNYLEQIFQESDSHAVPGAQGEGGQQLGQVGDVHLYKCWN